MPVRAVPPPLALGRRSPAAARAGGAALALALSTAVALGLAWAAAAPTPRAKRSTRTAKAKAPASSRVAGAAKDTIVARVGTRVITLADFRREWDRMPTAQRPSDPSELRARQLFLDDLVIRHLLAIAAVTRGGSLRAEQVAELSALRDRLMRNALYQKEIVDPIQVDDQELDRVRLEMSKILELRGWWFPDREMAQAWYTRLVSGTPLSRLEALASSADSRAPHLLDLGWHIREDLTEAVARVAFRLAPARWGEPVPYRDGWVLLQVIQSRMRPTSIDLNDKQAVRNEARRLRSIERRETNRREMAGQLQVRYLNANIDTLLNRFLLVPMRVQPSDTGPGMILANLPLPAFSRPDSALVLATTVQGKVTGTDLLRYLNTLSSFERPDIRTHEALVAWVDRVAFDHELLVRAQRAGLENDPAVQRDLARRREGFLVEALYRDSVRSRVVDPEDSLRALFAADSARYSVPEAVRVWQCVVEGRAKADSLLREARAGADLGELARVHSLDEKAASGGQTGWLSRGQGRSPEIEEVAFSLPVGSFGGPVRDIEGWAILKVLEKRAAESPGYQAARPTVMGEFEAREEERQMQAFLQRLRARIRVESYPERLAPLVSAARSP